MGIRLSEHQDCFEKLQLVVTRCNERNVRLKMSKPFIGVTMAIFFGYEIEAGSYRLSEERRLSVTAIPMPVNTKQMQRFLGMALYFKSHIPGYSKLTAGLTEMSHKDFSWNRSTWKRDYEADMQVLKDSLMGSHTLHFPDVACGSCLLQLVVPIACTGSGQPDVCLPTKQAGQQEFQVIAFVSHKFSGASLHWDIPKRRPSRYTSVSRSLTFT